MIRFFPLDAGISFDCCLSDLLGFDWKNKSADFCIPGDDDHVLRVRFEADVIVRMLDEMPLSIESDPETWQAWFPIISLIAWKALPSRRSRPRPGGRC
jgi:hypothetical protein